MPIKLNYKNTEYSTERIVWDRDSFFLDFNIYWSRIVGSIAQKIAEYTTNNWDKFNLIRTSTIKALGINLETSKCDSPSSPINLLQLNTLPLLLASSLKNILPEKDLDKLNILFQDIVTKALLEGQAYIKDAILLKNLELIKQLNKKVRQILITNDSKENNDFFLKEANIENYIYEVHTQVNKEQMINLLKEDSIFITNNFYLYNSYKKRKINNILLVDDLNKLSYSEVSSNNLITINIDGASKGNPGPASIGIVFYKDKNIINEIAELIGNKTNNFAEYTALIRALEISLEDGYKNIEIKSDSELVVNQINKKYKVKDPDIKELFDKANSLIEKFSSFKILHVAREENLKADKLANSALKVQNQR